MTQTTITLPVPVSLTAPAPADDKIATKAAEVRAAAREDLANLLDGLCDRLGLDRWEAWRRPSRHAQIEQFRDAIAPLSPDDALTRPLYTGAAA